MKSKTYQVLLRIYGSISTTPKTVSCIAKAASTTWRSTKEAMSILEGLKVVKKTLPLNRKRPLYSLSEDNVPRTVVEECEEYDCHNCLNNKCTLEKVHLVVSYGRSTDYIPTFMCQERET